MARVVVHQATLRVQTLAMAEKILSQVMFEVQTRAQTIALSGPYSTGNLALSIEKRGPTVVSPTRVSGAVGSNLPYAASVHSGAKIHDIFPKAAPHVYRFGQTGRPKLKFFWRKKGRVVYLPQIPGSPSTIGRSHPGQSGKHFITDPLRTVARRHGFHYVTYEL